SGTETSMQTILEWTLEAAGLMGCVEIRQMPKRRVDIPRHVASIQRLRLLGFSCRYSLRRTIQDLLEYYRGCFGGGTSIEMIRPPLNDSRPHAEPCGTPRQPQFSNCPG